MHYLNAKREKKLFFVWLNVTCSLFWKVVDYVLHHSDLKLILKGSMKKELMQKVINFSKARLQQDCNNVGKM